MLFPGPDILEQKFNGYSDQEIAEMVRNVYTAAETVWARRGLSHHDMHRLLFPSSVVVEEASPNVESVDEIIGTVAVSPVPILEKIYAGLSDEQIIENTNNVAAAAEAVLKQRGGNPATWSLVPPPRELEKSDIQLQTVGEVNSEATAEPATAAETAEGEAPEPTNEATASDAQPKEPEAESGSVEPIAETTPAVDLPAAKPNRQRNRNT